uniref:LysM domain-containing protein n=1 Tax=Steinernema glaseri TaxID=37863 RepID=A0A1I7ZJH8_9BILA
MTTHVLTHDVGHNGDDSSSSYAGVPLAKLRVRGRRSNDFDKPSTHGMTSIEHTIKPGDTINKIALQYHIQVSELKRANNLVSEQDLFARPSVKVPVSHLKRHLLLDSAATTSHVVEDPDLLRDFTENDPLVEPNAPASSVEAIFLEANAFHFIDARSPDSSFRGVWLLIALLVVIFVVIPICLTAYEEEAAEEHAKHVRNHH